MAERPFEQLKLDFGYQGLGGTFVGAGGSYDYASEGGTHHAAGDVAAMLAIPRMQVLVPGHGVEVDALLRATYANGAPTYVRTSLATNDEPLDVAPGRLEVRASRRRPDRGRLRADAHAHARGRRRPRRDGRLRDERGAVRRRRASRRSPASGRDVIAVEPWYEGSVGARGDARARPPAGDATASSACPGGFVHDYGTWAEIDADVGLDAAGIRARLAAIA